jgi:hypothetical protein
MEVRYHRNQIIVSTATLAREAWTLQQGVLYPVQEICLRVNSQVSYEEPEPVSHLRTVSQIWLPAFKTDEIRGLFWDKTSGGLDSL